MKIGREIEAIGDNRVAARLSGVGIAKVTTMVYVICGFLSAIAGILEAARINTVNAGTLGLGVELEAIAAVAIGGTSFSGGKAHVMGTIVGALLIQLVTVMVNMNNIPFHYSLVIKAAIVVLALYSQKHTDP
jgi:ribose/xylose/arabinose/galactoside ABC-type transport system permease subunit